MTGGKFILEFLMLMWRHSRAKTIALFVLTAIGSITDGIGLLVLVPLLGVLQNGAPEPGGFVAQLVDIIGSVGIPVTSYGLIGVFLASVILRNVIAYFRTVLSNAVQLELMDELRIDTFEALLGANWKWITSLKKSDHSNLLINEVDRVSDGLMYAVQILTSAVMIIVYLCTAAVLSLPMTLVAILVGAVVMYMMRRQHSLARGLGETLGTAYEDMQQVVEEGLSGIKLTKILGNEKRHKSLMARILETLRGQQLDFTKMNARATAIFQVMIAVFLAVFLFVGLEVLELPLPSLMILVLILSRMAPMLRGLQNQLNQLLHAYPALIHTNKTIAAARDAKDGADAPAHNDGNAVFALTDALEINDVGFAYATRDAQSLDNISIKIPARTTTAIMGASGAGKSTLADLIMGLLAPQSGRITVDGKVIDETNRRAWRHAVAYVPQDVFLFHDTIANNLRWARQDASDKDLQSALQKAACSFVFDLPEQMDTIVGDGGMRLSGGERQRIALARAMLQRPSLLILDEATSALDLENEARIRDAMAELHGDLTVIVIGHRLPTLEDADQVMVLDAGRVQAYGTWDDVTKKHPHLVGSDTASADHSKSKSSKKSSLKADKQS